jgi:hypothetical protein
MNSIAFTALAFYLTFLFANLLARRWTLVLPTLRRNGASPQDAGYYSDVYSGAHPTVADVAAQSNKVKGTVVKPNSPGEDKEQLP